MSLKFTKDHEWVDASNPAAAVVGVTDHAQNALGEVVYVELPEVGRSYQQGDVAGVLESVKAAADVYMPVSGEVVEVNSALTANGEPINKHPMGEGWLFKVKLSQAAELDGLMDAAGYDALAK